MTATYQIRTNDLNDQFINGLREKFGEAELEINVKPISRKDILSDAQFWQIMSLLDWSKTEDEAIVAPVIAHLIQLPVSFIYQFEDKIADKLFRLDAKKFAENIGEDAYSSERYFSVDNFLYVRCCVIANGKQFYESVLNDPTLMPKDLTFEPLLSIASDAYFMKTGRKFEYVPTIPIETYSNKALWA
jgi:Protein of unknown function (DUF4240)